MKRTIKINMLKYSINKIDILESFIQSLDKNILILENINELVTYNKNLYLYLREHFIYYLINSIKFQISIGELTCGK
jgi:hypothetical protein